MDLQLTDKVVVVTGAASGIGQATASLLTEEGAIVVGVDRDQIDTAPGARGTAVQADLTDPATPDRVIATVLEQHGRIDALVNNAGGLQARTSFLDITDGQWLATFNLNFHAARRMSRAAVPTMLASGGGSLVHLGGQTCAAGAVHLAGHRVQPPRHPVERRGPRTHPHPALRPARRIRRPGR
jgi:NAD(P)-dependent dehydrogenase (short-subunit alcohol dehydrogenase family)